MHEMSLIKEIMNICEANIRGRLKSVTKITLRIGIYASVSIHQLKYNFELLKEDTIFEGATLEIKRSKGMRYCKNCMCEYQFSLQNTKCPSCGVVSNEITAGLEMKIEGIEGEIYEA